MKGFYQSHLGNKVWFHGHNEYLCKYFGEKLKFQKLRRGFEDENVFLMLTVNWQLINRKLCDSATIVRAYFILKHNKIYIHKLKKQSLMYGLKNSLWIKLKETFLCGLEQLTLGT